MEKSSVNTAWWQKPSKATNVNEHRVVSVIELFCDLVFVAYIGSISHHLVGQMTFKGITTFIILFSIGWMIWLNSALYHDLHGNNDFRTRFNTFIQMILIGLMTVFTHDVLGHFYVYYVSVYAGITIFIGFLWRETGIADPSHLVYSKPYSRVYFLLGMLLIASIFFPHDYRSIYLGLSVIFLVAPMISNYLLADSKTKVDYVKRTKLSNAFIERSNLYFIIVLGEIVIGALNGASHVGINFNSVIMLIFNFLIAFGLWFNHFEFVGYIQHKESISGYFMWLFSFYLETIAVAFIGALVYLSYTSLSINTWIVPTVIFFIAIIIHFSFNKKINNPNIHLDTKHTKLFMVLSILILGVSYMIQVSSLQVVFYLVALYIPVILGVGLWIRHS
ncbi:low temperature requirement protein A [Acidaminobacter sp. JC074]|uniref:low temperature requirement protein A n=1 Tax=Acidaminobacter sp. JC074 TaxID=2530199 RepID=UPI001F0F5884|nr:low temperature requirement protein A [Acidaminobacter sp. JC074]